MINFEDFEAFAPPERCATCPVQQELATTLNGLQIGKLVITHAAEHLIGDSGKEIDDFLLTLANNDADLASQISTEVRQATSSKLNDVDARIDDIKQQSDALSRSCDKPLRLRATKEGREYTVTVCTSALNYMVNSVVPNQTPASVRVRTD